MTSRLPGAVAASLALFGLCLVLGRGETVPMAFLMLGALTLASDLAALPVPRRGHLSNGFVWAFVLAQLCDTPSAAVVLVVSLALRAGLFGKGTLKSRALHSTGELIPGLAALLVAGLLAGESSYGFPKGHLGAVAGLLVYYAVGRASLSTLYPKPAGPHGKLLKSATQARELQLRIGTVLAPTATLLAAGGLWRCLWVVPVMLGIHQFFWERLTELRELRSEGAAQKEKLQEKEGTIARQATRLSATKLDKDLVERCLENFSSSATLKQTADSVLRLAASLVSASSYVLFWESEAGFGPLLALDGLLKETELQQESFPAKNMLNRCYQEKLTFAKSGTQNWCFPLHEGGVLYLGNVQGTPTDQQKRNLALLARQASFGLRSAVLFEQLKDSLEQEQRARSAVEKAKHDLEQAQAHLIQSSKMAAVGQLAAGVAHELNSPLAAVLLAVQAGKRSLKKGRTEKALARFEQCEEAVGKAKVIANGLLTQSRKSSDKIEVTSLATVAQDTVEFLGERLSRSGTVCEFEAGGDPKAMVNTDEISQIITNLILNAHQAMTNAPTKAIRLSIKSEDAHAVLELWDSGPGIPPEHQERVFDPFFTTKTQGEGTGLGLYISSELARKNGGTLVLKSSSSKGTIFQLRLPTG